MNMQLRALLFDLDGTLTDSKPGITRCFQYAMERMGLEPPAAGDLDWCIGPPLMDSLARLLDTDDPARVRQSVTFYRERFAAKGMFENRVYDGIPETLQTLRDRGFQLYVATAKTSLFAEPILDHFGLLPLFTRVYGSRPNGELTEKSELIAHILTDTGLTPEQTMIIGDRKYDLLGGRANGLHTGAVTYGYGTETELLDTGADLFFHHPAQIAADLPRFYDGAPSR